MIWQFYCDQLVNVVSLVLFCDVDVVKRSFLCFAQHDSTGHLFSKMAAVTNRIDRMTESHRESLMKISVQLPFQGNDLLKVFIIIWMFTLLRRIHNLQWQSLFLHQIVPTLLLPITFKCSKLQSLPTRGLGGGGGWLGLGTQHDFPYRMTVLVKKFQSLEPGAKLLLEQGKTFCELPYFLEQQWSLQ